MDASELLDGVTLMPVVVLDHAEAGVPLARALLDAGVRAIEITLRTPAALEAIERVARDVPEIIVGAGSIRRPDQFAQVRAAGARFAVSPGSTGALLGAVDLPWVPGAATPSEVLRLLDAGYRLQKFFPAEQNGGAAALRAIGAPIPEVRFCPTGGVNANNARDYLALNCVSCVGGSWFVPADAVAEGEFQRVSELAREALELTDG